MLYQYSGFAGKEQWCEFLYSCLVITKLKILDKTLLIGLKSNLFYIT